MNLDLLYLLDKQLTKNELTDLIKYELGSSDPKSFQSEKRGGLRLMQIPRELSSLLFLMKEEIQPKTYLQLGIDNGSEWAILTHYIKSLQESTAVGSLKYKEIDVFEEIQKFFRKESLRRKITADFYQKSINKFFALSDKREYDIVILNVEFVYEEVKRDYIASLNLLNKGGYIVFLGIASRSKNEGVRQLWGEVKNDHEWKEEYVYSDNCGIGVVRIG